jgi:hypothetical protein
MSTKTTALAGAATVWAGLVHDLLARPGIRPPVGKRNRVFLWVFLAIQMIFLGWTIYAGVSAPVDLALIVDRRLSRDRYRLLTIRNAPGTPAPAAGGPFSRSAHRTFGPYPRWFTHSEACAGSTARWTTLARSACTAFRSTASFSRAANTATIWSAS